MPAAWKRTNRRTLPRVLNCDHRSKAEAETNGEPPLSAAAAASSDLPAAKNGPRPSKPQRWLRAPFAGDRGAMFSTMATLASEIITVTGRSPRPAAPPALPPPDMDEVSEDGLRSPPPRSHNVLDDWSLPYPTPPVACGARPRKREDLGSVIGEGALTVETLQGLPQSGVPREAFCHASEASTRGPGMPRKGLAIEACTGAEKPETEASDGGSSRRFTVIAKVFVFLVILVIGTKKVALGISISVVATFIEAIGRRLIPVPRLCKEVEKSSDDAGQVDVPVSDLVLSPEGSDCLAPSPEGSDSISSEQIQVESSESCVLDSGSERSWHAEAPLKDAPLAMLLPARLVLEEKEHVEAEGGRGDHRRRWMCGKRKKLLKKLW